VGSPVRGRRHARAASARSYQGVCLSLLWNRDDVGPTSLTTWRSRWDIVRSRKPGETIYGRRWLQLEFLGKSIEGWEWVANPWFATDRGTYVVQGWRGAPGQWQTSSKSPWGPQVLWSATPSSRQCCTPMGHGTCVLSGQR